MIGNRIKEIRDYFHMTQTQFAEHIGKTMRTVQKWESGDKIPESSVNMICKTFNINEDWLMSGDGEMFNKINNNQYAIGSNIIQSNGHGAVLQILSSSSRVKDAVSEDMQELLELIVQYASPAMIREWKSKLLKIKKLHEE